MELYREFNYNELAFYAVQYTGGDAGNAIRVLRRHVTYANVTLPLKNTFMAGRSSYEDLLRFDPLVQGAAGLRQWKKSSKPFPEWREKCGEIAGTEQRSGAEPTNQIRRSGKQGAIKPMFVFMGTYSPGSSNSGSDNDNQGDESAEDTDDRRLDDFSTDDDGAEENVSEDETIGSDGSAGGNAGAGVAVTGQPSSRDPEEDVEEDVDQEEGEDEKGEEDEEQDDNVVIVQKVDPLNAMSWGVQPVMKRVEERYQDKVEIYYRSASVREFKDPAEVKQ